MLKRFFKQNSIRDTRQQFLFITEKLANIALAKTQLGDTKTVKSILEEIEKIFRKFWDLKRNNPEKFETFLWSEDFYERFVSPTEIQKSETDSPSKNAEELKREAAFRLSLRPERELLGLTQFLDSYKKIWQAGYTARNDEVSRYVIYKLNGLLSELVQEENNQLFVEQFLRLLNSISVEAIKESRKPEELDRSIYAATIHWYTDIVFNRLRQSKKGFDLSYLEVFDKYFFSILRFVITEGQTTIFHNLVSSLVDGIHVPDYYRGEVWNYGHIILHKNLQKYNKLNAEHGLEKIIKELVDSESDLNTRERLEVWLKKFGELKAIIEPNLNNEQKKSAIEIEDKIRDFATSQFKYQNLLEIIFATGAYCLFKGKYGYIKYLWEYKQPPDSDASWVGHDIIPLTLKEVIKFYFRKGLFEKKLDFWEGHHGSEKYYKQYFLLLLARILQTEPVDAEGKYPQIENYNLPDLHVYRLSDLQHSIDEFVGLASELKQAGNMLAEIGFNTTKLEETFDRKLIFFLNKLKDEAEKQISAKHKSGNISQKRIGEFKKEVLKTFYEGAHLRNIFSGYLKEYHDKTKEKTDKKERFGVNIVDDKASFFDEWHVHYVGWGENYGRDLASGENSYLLDDIAKDCKEINKEEFEATLAKIGNIDNIVIFATNIAFWRFFEDSKNFKPKWLRDIKQLAVKGFGGWYDFNGKLIPVFETYHRKIDKQILILNKSKIGQLVQLSPLNEGEKGESIEDIFYMDVQAFSENEELMEEFIKKPPEWLQKIGDGQKQREHLRERVRIQIFERFEYKKSEGFEGYKLFLEEG